MKKGLHPRNQHAGRYDFARLVAASPELSHFVARKADGEASIDFADPNAVRALNRALLKSAYGVGGWDFPPEYLCPPIPGRADLLHTLADLLAQSNGGVIPRGDAIRVLDVGVGANCIYPLIGHSEYGWRFVGTDIDRAALACARAIADANSGHREAIELRFQADPLHVFQSVLHADERFDLVVCNPPFHASLDAASAGSARKWKHLGKGARGEKAPLLNFGGQSQELCCAGGEAGFIGRMIGESTRIANRCLWFTALVAKASSLPAVRRALKSAGVQQNRTISMAHGQKNSRVVAWSYLNGHEQQAWGNAWRAEAPARTAGQMGEPPFAALKSRP